MAQIDVAARRISFCGACSSVLVVTDATRSLSLPPVRRSRQPWSVLPRNWGQWLLLSGQRRPAATMCLVHVFVRTHLNGACSTVYVFHPRSAGQPLGPFLLSVFLSQLLVQGGKEGAVHSAIERHSLSFRQLRFGCVR
ncbi:hypothetical protein MTO96_011383 [Rhipicephalus appendiculatus]